jgi:N-acetylglucosamine-6-phosphate deacetylase
MPAGTYRLGDRTVTVDGTTARLADGTLAGSILTLDAGVRKMLQSTGCPLVEALAMVSSTPARILGLARKGRIAAGCDADLAILDVTGSVAQTWARGEQIYVRP